VIRQSAPDGPQTPFRESQSPRAHLEKQGYRNVAIYPGGKADWVEAGPPLENSAATRGAIVL